ncbi:hypothetical protein BGZ57DRAFT_102175 [Hyaloscypha finlandica]|nr:hypothetical protein BGZ57DRAFT_102175 [Hyaloscypha finlandica]
MEQISVGRRNCQAHDWAEIDSHNAMLVQWATAVTKCSVLVLIYQVASAGSREMATVVLIAVALIAVECLIFRPSVIFQCEQPSLYWTLSLTPQSNCISETKNPLAAGIINMVTDFVVVVLPCRQYGSSSFLYSSRSSLRCSSGLASSSTMLVPYGITIYTKSRSVGIRLGQHFQPG